MTNQNTGTPVSPFLPSLGAGRIIADTFSIYFGGFFRTIPVGFAILFISNAIVYQIYGDLGQSLTDETGNFLVGKMIISNVVVTVGYSIFMCFVILAAADIKQGQSFRGGGYLLVAISCLLPVIILQIVYGIGVGLGIALLVVPGLYLMAMWSVVLPAILIDQVGLSGLQRSADLTQNYRWSILGPLAVITIAAYIIIFFSTILAMGSFEAIINPKLGTITWTAVVIQVLGSALGSGLLSVGSLVIFNRLKEIKEGGGVTSEFAEVFD